MRIAFGALNCISRRTITSTTKIITSNAKGLRLKTAAGFEISPTNARSMKIETGTSKVRG